MRGTDITGTMKKFWLCPYWQTDALDAWLSEQEASGWRLVSSTHFRRLIFQAAEPKHAQWFMTFGEKAEHMFDAEGWLKRNQNADEIKMPVLLPGFFAWENAYRVLAPIGEDDLRELRLARNLYLRRQARKSLCFWLFALAACGLLVGWSLAAHGFPVSASGIVVLFLAILSLFLTGYHITGLCALRRQRIRY